MTEYMLPEEQPHPDGNPAWQEMLSRPLHIDEQQPKRQLTTKVNRERIQLVRRFTSHATDAPYEFASVYEVQRLGHADHPLTVGWLAFTDHYNQPGGRRGWYVITRRHDTWTWSDPVWDDDLGYWAQDLHTAVVQVVEDLL